MKSEIKSLAIKQPWATAIIYFGKDIENRTWNTKYRGIFDVHSSKEIDKNAPQWVWDLVKNHYSLKWTGGIIGQIELVDVVTKSESKWFNGPYGFVLKNPKPMMFLKQKGQLGFFKTNFLSRM